MRMRHATPRCREAGEPLRFCRSFRHRGRTKRLNRFMKPATARPHGIGKNRHRGGPRVLSRGLIRVAAQAFACGVQKVFSIFPRAVDGVLPESPPLTRVKFSQHASRSHYSHRCPQPAAHKTSPAARWAGTCARASGFSATRPLRPQAQAAGCSMPHCGTAGAKPPVKKYFLADSPLCASIARMAAGTHTLGELCAHAPETAKRVSSRGHDACA